MKSIEMLSHGRLGLEEAIGGLRVFSSLSCLANIQGKTSPPSQSQHACGDKSMLAPVRPACV